MKLSQELAAEKLACVIAIQSVFRGYLQRKRLVQEGDGALSHAGAMQRSQMRQEAAAIIIQARVRAFVAEFRYLRQLADVILIQSVVRRWLALSQVQTLSRSKQRRNVVCTSPCNRSQPLAVVASPLKRSEERGGFVINGVGNRAKSRGDIEEAKGDHVTNNSSHSDKTRKDAGSDGYLQNDNLVTVPGSSYRPKDEQQPMKRSSVEKANGERVHEPTPIRVVIRKGGTGAAFGSAASFWKQREQQNVASAPKPCYRTNGVWIPKEE
jgi:hypothetical protein